MGKKKAIAKKEKMMSDRQHVIDTRRQIKGYIAQMLTLRPYIQRYTKLGSDFYLTCNHWLFTEDVRMDPAKLANAVDDLLLIRKYSQISLTLYTKYISNISRAQELQKTLSKTKDILTVSGDFMQLAVETTASGEEMVVALLDTLAPVFEKHKDTILATVGKEFVDFVGAIIQNGRDELETMKNANLAKMSEEDQQLTDKINEMLDHPEDLKEGELTDALNQLAGVDALKSSEGIDEPTTGEECTTGEENVLTTEENEHEETPMIDQSVTLPPVPSYTVNETGGIDGADCGTN